MRFARSIEAASYRGTERIDSRRSFPSLFMFFPFFVLFVEEESFSQALVSASDDRRFMSYRILCCDDHKHTMNPHPHFTCRYLCVCVCVYVCVNVCACVCVSRSPSVLYLVYHKSGKKKERKLYIGTSKKVYFTIPLAVEHRTTHRI